MKIKERNKIAIGGNIVDLYKLKRDHSNVVTNIFCSEITLQNLLNDINLKIRIGKRTYLFKRESLVSTLEHNLSYGEKVDLFNNLLKIKDRNSDITHYLKILLIGVITRKEQSLSVMEEANAL
jgi:hypothetical protein